MAKVQSVFLTGANRSIGYHLLQTILKRLNPDVVFATYRSPEKSKELFELAKQNKHILPLQMDIRDYDKHEEIAQLVDVTTNGSGLNLLINNAGISNKFRYLKETTEEDLREQMECNFIAPLLLTKALTPLLEKASAGLKSTPCGIGRAAVVNISSIMGSIGLNEVSGMYGYRCSKAATNMATKNMSIEFKKSKIISIALHPGWVKTAMGGPKAPLTPEESTEGIVTLLEKLNETHNGQFLEYDGKVLQW